MNAIELAVREQCSTRGIVFDDIAPNHDISWGNSKLKKDGIASFNLPPVSTCPAKGVCATWCYATAGLQWMLSGFKKRVAAYKATQLDDFATVMVAHLISEKVRILRVHDSGDFYSPQYLAMWCAIAEKLPHVKFYAYTKQIILVKLFRRMGAIPKNLNIVQSLGGKFDHLIDESFPHAKIFHNIDELLAAGYVDTTESDLPASDSANIKIGLVIHGSKKAKFSQ